MKDPDNVLFSARINDAHGLSGVVSKTTRIGMFAFSTQELHVMTTPDPVVNTGDSIFFEAADFCRDLVACTPDLLSVVWSDRGTFDVMTESGEELLDNRSMFLSAPAVRNAFLEEARYQIELMDVRLGDFSPEAKARTSDAAQHLLRLCWQGFQLYRTGYLPNGVDEPKRFFAFGQRVADGAIDEARAVLAEYRQKFTYAKSELPETFDGDKIDRWLRFTRLKFL